MVRTVLKPIGFVFLVSIMVQFLAGSMTFSKRKKIFSVNLDGEVIGLIKETEQTEIEKWLRGIRSITKIGYIDEDTVKNSVIYFDLYKNKARFLKGHINYINSVIRIGNIENKISETDILLIFLMNSRLNKNKLSITTNLYKKITNIDGSPLFYDYRFRLDCLKNKCWNGDNKYVGGISIKYFLGGMYQLGHHAVNEFNNSNSKHYNLDKFYYIKYYFYIIYKYDLKLKNYISEYSKIKNFIISKNYSLDIFSRKVYNFYYKVLSSSIYLKDYADYCLFYYKKRHRKIISCFHRAFFHVVGCWPHKNIDKNMYFRSLYYKKCIRDSLRIYISKANQKILR